MGIFSIRSEKMIGVGEGGVIVTNNVSLYKKAEKLGSRNSPFRGKKIHIGKNTIVWRGI